MTEILLKLFIILGCFFYLILTIVMYLFSTYCILNRKKLKLGFSKSPATIIDLLIIAAIPIAMTSLAIAFYYDFNTY